MDLWSGAVMTVMVVGGDEDEDLLAGQRVGAGPFMSSLERDCSHIRLSSERPTVQSFSVWVTHDVRRCHSSSRNSVRCAPRLPGGQFLVEGP